MKEGDVFSSLRGPAWMERAAWRLKLAAQSKTSVRRGSVFLGILSVVSIVLLYTQSILSKDPVLREDAPIESTGPLPTDPLLLASDGLTLPKTGKPHSASSIQKRSKVNIPDLLLEQLHRKLHIESVCRIRSTAEEEERPTANPIIPSRFHALFVDDTNRILYCEVPKVACSNWKRVLLMLTGKINTTRLEDLQSAEVHSTLERKYLKRLDTYSAPEIRFRIDTYYKFMFVRNPLERLLSAYRNKFTASYNTYFPKTFGRKIIKRFRPRPTNDSLAKGHDVTFEEFIKYLLDAKIRQGAPMNAHWRPFHELCMPCTIPYDLIGKYETMDEDVSLALQQMRVNVTFPKAYYSGTNRTSSKLVQTYSNITGPELESLFRLYFLDFDMFEYDFPRSMKNPS